MYDTIVTFGWLFGWEPETVKNMSFDDINGIQRSKQFRNVVKLKQQKGLF